MKSSVFLHSTSNTRFLHPSLLPHRLPMFSSRGLSPQACQGSGCSEYPPTMQQDAVGNPGSPSTVITPTPAPRREKQSAARRPKRVNRFATRAHPAEKAAPGKSSPVTQPGSANTATTVKRSPKRKTEKPSRSEATNPAGASITKRARRADVIVEYHGIERRPRPWRDCPPDAYVARLDRINRTRYVVTSNSSTLL